MRNKAIIGIILIAVAFFYFNPTKTEPQNPSPSAPVKPASETDSPKIISTKPNPLEEAVVPVDGIIEITFNRSLENVGEFKLRIEPKIDFKVELSGDRKTAKIIPLKPYELGVTYTLFIGQDTKFDGVGGWRQEKIYHFKTIKYRGV